EELGLVQAGSGVEVRGLGAPFAGLVTAVCDEVLGDLVLEGGFLGVHAAVGISSWPVTAVVMRPWRRSERSIIWRFRMTFTLRVAAARESSSAAMDRC